MTMASHPISGTRSLLTHDDYARLGRIAYPFATYDEYATILDLPLNLAIIRPSHRLALDYDHAIGSMNVESQLALNCKVNAQDLWPVAAQLIVECKNAPKYAGGPMGPQIADDILKSRMIPLTPIVFGLLGSIHRIYDGQLGNIRLDFEQNIATGDPMDCRAPQLHRDRVINGNVFTELEDWNGYVHPDQKRLSPTQACEIIVKSAATTECIADRIGLTAEGRALTKGLSTHYKLSPPELKTWFEPLRQSAFFFQPRPYVAVLKSPITLHKSHMPEVPAPSGFLRLSVSPTL